MTDLNQRRKDALEDLIAISQTNKFTELFYSKQEFIIICGLFLDAMADRMIQLGKDEGIPKQDIAKMSESLINQISKLVKTYTNVDLGDTDSFCNNDN